MRRTRIIAHRGASGHHPEHTAEAVLAGFALGADAVEPDLVPSRDGLLVVRHEPEISRTTDIGERLEFADRRRTIRVPPEVQAPGDPIDELTGWFTFDLDWAELARLEARERLPELRPDSAGMRGALLRFTDLLELVAPLTTAAGEPAVVVAELKHPSAFAALGIDLPTRFLAEIEGRLPVDRLVVECFELPALLRLRELGYPGRLVHLSERPVDHAALRAAGVEGVSYDKALLLEADGADLVADAHAAGLEVLTWTLRPENAFLAPRHRGPGGDAAWGDWRAEFAEILATGVDGVFADHPELAAEAIAARRAAAASARCWDSGRALGSGREFPARGPNPSTRRPGVDGAT